LRAAVESPPTAITTIGAKWEMRAGRVWYVGSGFAGETTINAETAEIAENLV
jgi:hypothetical protein